MSLKLNYSISQENINNDIEVFQKSNINFKTLHSIMSLPEFLDSFGTANIQFQFDGRPKNSFFIKGAIMGFCYNYYAGLLKLRENPTSVEHAFGTEYDEYHLEYYLKDGYLVIINRGVEYTYDFENMFSETCLLFERVMEELPQSYIGLHTCKYYIEIKKKHML